MKTKLCIVTSALNVYYVLYIYIRKCLKHFSISVFNMSNQCKDCNRWLCFHKIIFCSFHLIMHCPMLWHSNAKVTNVSLAITAKIDLGSVFPLPWHCQMYGAKSWCAQCADVCNVLLAVSLRVEGFWSHFGRVAFTTDIAPWMNMRALWKLRFSQTHNVLPIKAFQDTGKRFGNKHKLAFKGSIHTYLSCLLGNVTTQ